jgi:hypothetical protein
MAILTLRRLWPRSSAQEVVGQLAWIQVADQAAGLRPRWSLGAYCGPRRDNTLSSGTVSRLSGADHAPNEAGGHSPR